MSPDPVARDFLAGENQPRAAVNVGDGQIGKARAADAEFDFAPGSIRLTDEGSIVL